MRAKRLIQDSKTQGSAAPDSCGTGSFVTGVTKVVTRPARGRSAIASYVRPTPKVVLALEEGVYPNAALLHAEAMARATGAALHVIRILRVQPRRAASPGGRSTAGAWEKPGLDAHRATRQWLEDSLVFGRVVEQLATVRGRFIEQVTRYSAEVKAALIVIPAEATRLGAWATSLAAASGAHVLVPRMATANETIVAATDLRSAHCPVLRTAAELSSRLDSPLVAVHNVPALSAALGSSLAWPILVPFPSAPVRELRGKRLKDACRQLSVEARVVVREERRTALAILDEARSCEANLVVVGERPRSWLQCLLGENVAAHVVEHAHCSVLVTPIVELRQGLQSELFGDC